MFHRLRRFPFARPAFACVVVVSVTIYEYAHAPEVETVRVYLWGDGGGVIFGGRLVSTEPRLQYVSTSRFVYVLVSTGGKDDGPKKSYV